MALVPHAGVRRSAPSHETHTEGPIRNNGADYHPYTDDESQGCSEGPDYRTTYETSYPRLSCGEDTPMVNRER